MRSPADHDTVNAFDFGLCLHHYSEQAKTASNATADELRGRDTGVALITPRVHRV